MKESVLSFEEKQHNLGLSTLKLPTSTERRLRLTRFQYNDYKDIGSSSVVYIFHKGILS